MTLLYQTDQIAPKNLNEYAFIGELSLDGRIRPCTGVLSMITEARKCGVSSVIVPYGNRQEAESVSGINIYPVSTLSDTVKLLESGVLMDPGEGLIKMRPFRAPHHNVSLNALIGGGSYAQPGEVSLSHNGALFLDELAEFSRSTLDALRQPMEDKRVTISRVNGTNSYPANFMFVAAMN
ncbi:Subunit ChlI of Mg-chelatase [Oribacterium sp. KHPX15]|uniref:ATP-binding protein n=1 Tax=Oribacterium sp. KHPX15 TaxID=1855342 RepID=UPI000896C7D0|nr:ATP-binding protein [Oribacterium sp. KHPX15]SEA91079.1 Subunit ChlI of Mg-chelatase [Oribacterium sp. KHPX15]